MKPTDALFAFSMVFTAACYGDHRDRWDDNTRGARGDRT